MSKNEPKPLVDAHWVQWRLGLKSVDAVRYLRLTGSLPFVALGKRKTRYRPEDIEELIRKNLTINSQQATD